MRALNSEFDIMTFHDVILKTGSRPIAEASAGIAARIREMRGR
ncbi:MAG TPA: hypothetical protein VNH64_07330 [Parvularculaceae bacterium]|nr:hypothetical protein [Parvularculaceae bacterium]